MVLYFGGLKNAFALIAQLDRASGYGPEGREFESLRACQKTCEACFIGLFVGAFRRGNKPPVLPGEEK